MRLSAEQRSALQTIGNAAIGVGLGMSVLVTAFVVSQFAAGQGKVPTTTSSSASAIGNAVATATPAPPPPTPAPSPTPTPAPTAPPASATPAPTPSPTPEPVTVTAYANSGRRYAALSAPVGHVFTSPLAGTVQVLRYQVIDGEVRVGSAVPSLPFFPYIIVSSADRRVTFRPGALGVDTEVIVTHGDRVEPGTPLFKTIGEGASSWRSFYDSRVTANVIASVVALPSGADVDPVAFFMTR